MAETTICTRCGATMTRGASPQGLCARCLLQVGLESKGSAADFVATGPGDALRKPPPTVEELAPHFPQLEILGVLGQGGMGVVYRARQKGLGREVALKILTVDTASDPSFAERFEREAKTLASLTHPSIVHVHDFGRAGPLCYLVMELVDGASLRQMLRAKTVSPRDALSIVAQMCDALQYAHDEGVVHRDIKPENVLVGRRGQVKVLDFGLAKLMRGRTGPDPLTKSGQAMGTPYYMAPEQWEHPLEVDHRADIYSLGVVFYELLTGELPVGRFALPSHRIEVDVRLDDVVVKTLEREPERRYQQASEVKTAVDHIAATAPPVAFPPSVAAAPRGRRVWPWVVGAAGILLVIGVPFLAFALLLAGRSTTAERARAVAEGARLAQLDAMARAGSLPPRTAAAIPQADLVFPRAPGEPSPRLNPRIGKTSDAEAAEIEQVNQILRHAYQEYWDLEAKHTQATRTADGHFHISIGAFVAEWEAVRASLPDRLKTAFAGASAKWDEVVENLTRLEHLPWGLEPVEIEMWEDAGFHATVVRSQGKTFLVWSELPAEFRRFWDLGSALPPR